MALTGICPYNNNKKGHPLLLLFTIVIVALAHMPFHMSNDSSSQTLNMAQVQSALYYRNNDKRHSPKPRHRTVSHGRPGPLMAARLHLPVPASPHTMYAIGFGTRFVGFNHK